jgi:cytochrome c-type biogenesis protein CcmH
LHKLCFKTRKTRDDCFLRNGLSVNAGGGYLVGTCVAAASVWFWCIQSAFELERDRAGGGISAADFETTCDELQLRLLDETQNANPGSTVSPKAFWTPRKMVAVMGVLIPLSAAGLYAWLGTPSAIVRAEAPTQAVSNPQVLKMVETLAERLKANPDNPKGWAMLARSYKVLGRFDEAEQAYLKAGDIVNSDPNLLVDYADLLAVRANSIDGRPLELVNKALQLDPLQPTALMMSGVAAYHRGDYAF